jgi:2-polyprenyl-3-methyl-5-hydroxy-6-metoxy-1,4-benzoquinol methylase
MISTPQQFSVLMDELASSSWTLAALGYLFDSGLAERLREPQSLDELAASCPTISRERIERCVAVAVVRGVATLEEQRYRLAPGVLPSLEPGRRTVLQGEYRSCLLQSAAYLSAASVPTASRGWAHTDPVILQAQGDGSSTFAAGLKANLIQELGDLAARFDRPGAAFLDIGAGVGALSIAMAREFPRLNVVGIDPYDVPLHLARENVSRAGLTDRIAFRQLRIEDLRDEAAFDLVWLPTFFLGSRENVARATERIRAALRPGGWLLSPTINPATGEAQRAIWSLVLDAWGGPALEAPEAEALFSKAGLSTRALPGPSWTCLVVGQRV